MYGGVNATKQVAYAWAVSLGGDEGAVLLRKLGLLEQVGGVLEEGDRWDMQVGENGTGETST